MEEVAEKIHCIVSKEAAHRHLEEKQCYLLNEDMDMVTGYDYRNGKEIPMMNA
jgi:hypothetical protein